MIFNHTINIENNIAFINIEGELIEKNQATNLLVAVEELNTKGITKLALNLENLKYMNSSGLNTLIQLLTKARVGGGEAVLFNLNKKINELILITKLNTLFKIVSTKEEAVKLLE
ncbi:MAG: STAS domain-containing protein [Bacteroidetes bacterium]|nr:STAS domain-containing protein [Bacteroidota bacterium]